MQTAVDFFNLPKFQKRQFIPEDLDLQDKRSVEEAYLRLLDWDIQSKGELEQWLLARSELEAALSQEAAAIYIQMTCQTDDEQRVETYKRFIETIEPIMKKNADALNKKFIKELQRFPLDEDRYGIYIREIKTELDIFEPENIPLQTQEEMLCQQFQSICGAMTVQFEGKEQTLPQMAKYLAEPDRHLRERAWRETANRRLKDKEALEDLFNRMLKTRVQIAKKAGLANYRDYKFKSLYRFDYTPEDCKAYHSAIEKLVVPLWGRILKSKARIMKLERLRPWDLSVNAQGRPPLKPFERASDLIEGCKKIFMDMDETLGRQFSEMAQRRLLDLESYKGKAPGGYQHGLHESRLPFIFMNAVGLDGDMRTLLHEAGHAFHLLACRNDPIVAYRHGPMEFNEVASMVMELLVGERIRVFYTPAEIKRSIVSNLKDIIFILVWVAVVDAFQHWIYENPDHTDEERSQAWINIRKRFGSDFVDWDGLELEHRYLWHRQLHIFELPFYYIEYGIAQLGALQLWLNAKRDWKKALSDYKKGLSLGGSKPLPQLYEAAGIRFDFKEATIAPLMDAIVEELSKKIANF